jgi:selenocysteine-specific elongation factor
MTVVATAGHVDHGKSSLVHALTGTDPDRLAEEKRRGLTIDLGFAHMTLPSGGGLSFVDVPGHVRFLPNMLAGVGGIAGCLFVVDASEGWKPQTEEHLRILVLLGLQHGVIAITKSDLVDAELLEMATLDVAEHVAGTFLESAPAVAVSALSGEGLDELRGALDRLVESTGVARDRGRARLWVDRSFAAKGSGTVVTGTLADGSIRVGDQVEVEPGHRSARVRAIEHGGSGRETIGPGERVALNLASIDHRSIGRGDAVVAPERWSSTDRFDASLTVLPALGHDVSRRGAYLAYVGAGEHTVTMRILGREALAPGTTGTVRMHLPVALPLLPGDRFILRESGRDETIGGGEVLDISPVTKAAEAAPDRTVERVVRERGWVTVDQLERLTGDVVEPTIGHWVTAPDAVEALASDIRSRVGAAGPLGLDVALLDERERAVVAAMPELEAVDGRLRPIGVVDVLADHPYLEALLAGGFAPPSPADIERTDLRELIRRGDVVQRDGICFHRDTITAAAQVAEGLLAHHTDGFTMGEFRDATAATRKFCVPLLEELDARGITRRRGDLRIAGPRLTAAAHP